MNKIPAPEEAGLHKEWYIEAKKQTIETLPAFMNHILNDYELDYGTICHAVASCAVAAARAANHSEQGGITSFQAGAIMWEFVRHWLYLENQPLRLVDFKNMLYPQYQREFEKIISKDTWAWLQEQAKKKLEEDKDASECVLAHWASIADGKIPFGYEIEKDNE